MEALSKPRVLLVYYSYTQQAKKVVDEMSAVLTERGCDVDQAPIEFTDKRYMDRFTRFPLKRTYRDMFGVLPAQLRRATGQIRIPEEAKHGGYDLVVVGSPTWWLTTSMPIRSFLKSEEAGSVFKNTQFSSFVVCRRYWGNNQKTVRKLGVRQGGEYVDGVHFKYPGRQIRSLLSLISYLDSGEYRERYLGVKIPTTNLQPEQLDEAREFAGRLAEGLNGSHRSDATSSKSTG